MRVSYAVLALLLVTLLPFSTHASPEQFETWREESLDLTPPKVFHEGMSGNVYALIDTGRCHVRLNDYDRYFFWTNPCSNYVDRIMSTYERGQSLLEKAAQQGEPWVYNEIIDNYTMGPDHLRPSVGWKPRVEKLCELSDRIRRRDEQATGLTGEARIHYALCFLRGVVRRDPVYGLKVLDSMVMDDRSIQAARILDSIHRNGGYWQPVNSDLAEYYTRQADRIIANADAAVGGAEMDLPPLVSQPMVSETNAMEAAHMMEPEPADLRSFTPTSASEPATFTQEPMVDPAPASAPVDSEIQYWDPSDAPAH
ncbi:MAG: hypothetical protein HQL50_10945 [Magnetococcales bacterium]|nr:hypothetical protein [Magnetococcales bacterium]